MNKIYSDKEWKTMSNEYDKSKFICSCGHRVIIPKWVDKTICKWCNNYVFRDKKLEFKYRINERLRNDK